MQQRFRSYFIPCFVMLALVVPACRQSNNQARPSVQTVRVTVWHTEMDPDAQKVLGEATKAVEDEFAAGKGGFIPVFSVTALDWGDVATRLLQDKENPPDVTHLEPFMVGQIMGMYRDPHGYTLHPLDNLIQRIGPAEDLEPSVRKLQAYNDLTHNRYTTFGLAYAVGTTYIAYRSDWNRENRPLPKTWEELIPFADALAKEGSRQTNQEVAPFILPGKTPFFVDQLLNEMVVSLGGSLFHNQKPHFDTPEMRRALALLQQMIARTKGAYEDTAYREQFELFAEGKGAVVPVTYGRATKQIDSVLDKDGGSEAEKANRRLGYAVMPQPGPTADRPGVATIDAEPWVVIARPSSVGPEREFRLRVAERFLEEFYQRDRYLRFCETVPVHLRPVLRSLTARYDQAPWQRRWQHWVDVGRAELVRPNGTAPILMDPEGGGARFVTFALSLQREAVLSDMVLDATEPIRKNQPASTAAIDRALERASARAENLYGEANGQGTE